MRVGLVCAMTIGLLTGCGSGNHLLGQWTDESGKYLETIRADGTYSQDAPDGPFQVHIDGTWTYVGQKLHYQPTGFTVTGGKPADAAAERQALSKRMMKTIDLTLEWQDDDHFFGTYPDGGKTELKRKK